jgi:hypothetical protein
MKLTISIILIVLFLLFLLKHNSNNLNFLTNNGDKEHDEDLVFFSLETFNNIPKNFICNEDETACILVYQNYNNKCKESFPIWKKFQDMNHGRKLNGQKIKVFAVDSSLNPNLGLSGNVDGPRVSLVSRYDLKEYDGRMNLENLEKFLEKNV